MASTSFAPTLISGRRVPLAEIDAAVSLRLGPTRGLGNSQPACFNRQIAMYLAKHVGRWSTKIIGRFYNGRDHSTVCYGIKRIEALRQRDPEVDALVTDLTRRLCVDGNLWLTGEEIQQSVSPVDLNRRDLEVLADLIAAQVCRLLETRTPDPPRSN
jgi:Bacterial dnaA protein helix-turn-helix